jgi:putative colanic acid biosynthesis acetyltransferase WcaF
MGGQRVDVLGNRRAARYSGSETLARVLWTLARPLFSISPRPCFRWRRWLLRLFGAKVGRGVNVYASAHVYFPWNLEIGDLSSIGEGVLVYNLGKVVIGSRATVSLRAHLCAGTHDHSRADMPLLRPPIHVGDDVWICADAFVGPGTTIGAGSVVGARAVVVKSVDPWVIVAGNPARQIGRRVLTEAGNR